MRIDQIKKAAGDFDMNVNTAIKTRIRCLQSLLSQWIAYIDEQTSVTPESDMTAIINELIIINKSQIRENAGVVLNGITDDDIAQARDYPIESLIEFKNGKAMAFCHADNRPSLSLWKGKNRATCFPCGKSYSSLDVLILRDGMSFIDAVKTLSGGV